MLPLPEPPGKPRQPHTGAQEETRSGRTLAIQAMISGTGRGAGVAPAIRLLPASLAVLLMCSLLAGCTTPPPEPTPEPAAIVTVLDPLGSPVPFALVTLLDGTGAARLAFNADAEGAFATAGLPTFDHLVVAAAGQGQATASQPLPASIRLAPSEELAPVLAFRNPVELLCTTPDQLPTNGCGAFGEPVVEVAGDGAIWASATCCVGKSPPIWVSRDGGHSFKQLRTTDTGLVRDSFGIEGDLAIDDAGNVYFFDISAATFWFTSYEADGTHRWTVPWAGPPLVDRPWVRAGVADQVWTIYNSGTSTYVYESADGGRTWTPTPTGMFPCPLGNAGQGPTRNDLYVAAACDEELTVWTSRDGGKTWDAGDEVPMPDVKCREAGGRGYEVMNPPVADEAGNLYLPFTHFVDGNSSQNAIFVARRGPDGAWADPVQVSEPGLNRLPWGAAGRDGHVAFFWYQSEGTLARQEKAEWHLAAAASVDAAASDPHYQRTLADASVLHKGALGRSLGDFIEADLTPDGRAVVVYAKRVDGVLTNLFLSSDGGLDLAPTVFLNGP